MQEPPDVSEKRVRRLDADWGVEAGRVVIRHQRRGAIRRVVLRLFGISPVLTLRLDLLGSEVWYVLDGRTVAQVLDALRLAHPDQDDLPQRLGRYLGTLAGNGLIALD